MTATKPPSPPGPPSAALDPSDAAKPGKVPRAGSGSPGEDRERAVLELPVDELGLAAPPVDVSLSVDRLGTRYRLVAGTGSGDLARIRSWLDAVLAGHIEQVHARDGSLLAIVLDLPRALAGLVERARVRRVRVSADGAARATVVASTGHLGRLVEQVGWDSEAVDLRALSREDPGGDRLLTEVQQRTLEEALRAGFYEVPREITLSDLADRLDRSAAGLSTLLRRAERRVVEAYLDDDPFSRRLRTGVDQG